jgi:peptidoglycan/xylan/chitin deacetylase (PgdA/CDA1 family)
LIWLCLVSGVYECNAQQRALSFDDGPHPTRTPAILDVLRDEGVHATFCIIGENAASAKGRALVQRIAADGHELCNHSWDHPRLTHANVASEIARTDRAIAAATGTVPKILRAPYGDLRAVGACYGGRPFVGWGEHGDSNDWRFSFSHVFHVVQHMPAGEILLLHDVHERAESVRAIIRDWKARGTQFVLASQLWRNHCGAKVASGPLELGQFLK